MSTKAQNIKKSAMLLMTALLSLNSIETAQALPQLRDNQKTELSKTAKKMPRIQTPCVANTLLVMLKDPENRDSFEFSLKKIGAKVTKKLGGGELEMLLVETKSGELASTETKLKNDPHVKAVQRDFIAKAQFAYHGTNLPPRDPDYVNQTYLTEFGLPNAWAQARGAGITIGLPDSGCDSSNLDMMGKVDPGKDLFATSYNGLFVAPVTGDPTGHGTVMASVMVARADNGFRTVGIARDARICPFRVSQRSGDRDVLDEAKLIDAIYWAGISNIRIMNVSFEDPGYASSYANEFSHPNLWQALRWYHDRKNGLAFFPMKNTNEYDPNLRLPYAIMVAGYDRATNPNRVSNASNSIWFAAPAVGIPCSGRGGQALYLDGTSLSCAMISACAAVILSKNPGLTNDQVLEVMRRSCDNTTSGTWNQNFGWGVPRLDRALPMVQEQVLPRILFRS